MKRILILLIIIAALAEGLIAYSTHYYDAPGPLAEGKTVIFKRGEGFSEIAADLTAQGVIAQPMLFKAIAIGLGQARQFKAGEYAFPLGASPHQVMAMIAAGRVVVHKITIPEGLTVHEILQLIDKEPALDGQITGEIKEGSLLPETYHFTYGDTRQGVVIKMQQKMTALLTELWQKRKDGLPVATPEQALTLASVVEKETGVGSERARVAAVFVNRLKKNMRLQSDPTVVYGIEHDGPLGRALTTADLQAPTPYNTYTIDGLPPGPITNPGRASLEAALHPADTDDLYFVATGIGGHHFASSLAEHNKNVAVYRERRQTH